jgi:hypothetical protein
MIVLSPAEYSRIRGTRAYAVAAMRLPTPDVIERADAFRREREAAASRESLASARARGAVRRRAKMA